MLRVKQALDAASATLSGKIVTSRDPSMVEAQKLLRGLKMPSGIEKFQLPIVFGGDRPVYFFLTIGAPNAVVPSHVHHDEGIWRLMVSGSITINDKHEVGQGDWVYVPKKVPYTYVVGQLGCVILHTYH